MIGSQAADQRHHLDIAARLTFQAATGLHPMKVGSSGNEVPATTGLKGSTPRGGRFRLFSLLLHCFGILLVDAHELILGVAMNL